MLTRKTFLCTLAGLPSFFTSTCSISNQESNSVLNENIITKEDAEAAGWMRTALSSSSMDPTLSSGDVIYGPSTGAVQQRDGSYEGGTVEIEPGNIVVFRDPDSDFEIVKRCIATAGQTIDLISGDVYIDGVALSESYVGNRKTEAFLEHSSILISAITYPYTIPKGCIWVMGDNRTNSFDSRYFGPIKQSSVGMVALKVLNKYTNQLEDI